MYEKLFIPAQNSVCNTIKYWMENYWFDFKESKELLDTLMRFIKVNMESQPKLAAQLTRVYDKKSTGQDDNYAAQVNPQQCPKPIYTNVKGKSIRRDPSEAITRLSRTGSVMKVIAVYDPQK